jgi:hypothetical protein
LSASQSPLAVVGEGFSLTAAWLGLLVFCAVAYGFAMFTTKPA